LVRKSITTKEWYSYGFILNDIQPVVWTTIIGRELMFTWKSQNFTMRIPYEGSILLPFLHVTGLRIIIASGIRCIILSTCFLILSEHLCIDEMNGKVWGYFPLEINMAKVIYTEKDYAGEYLGCCIEQSLRKECRFNNKVHISATS
jgi:hypothetical protein